MKMFAIVASAALMIGATAVSMGTGWAGESAAKTRSDTSASQPRDNTGVNTRDRSGNTVTAQDQSEKAGDRELTQKIRKAIVADDSLSTNAKNVKVITINGVVTLRGPVANEQEKNAVAAKVNGIAGVKRLENQLEATAR